MKETVEERVKRELEEIDEKIKSELDKIDGRMTLDEDFLKFMYDVKNRADVLHKDLQLLQEKLERKI